MKPTGNLAPALSHRMREREVVYITFDPHRGPQYDAAVKAAGSHAAQTLLAERGSVSRSRVRIDMHDEFAQRSCSARSRGGSQTRLLQNLQTELLSNQEQPNNQP